MPGFKTTVNRILKSLCEILKELNNFYKAVLLDFYITFQLCFICETRVLMVTSLAVSSPRSLVETHSFCIMAMKTRRSRRDLQQAIRNNVHSLVSSDDENDTQKRDYTLNYGKAMKKKATACNHECKVQAEIKCGNHIFIFSATMYELYRDELRDHYQNINDDPESGVKVTFKDCKDRSGMIVGSQIRVSERTGNGCGQLKFVMNLYHTKSKLMVNGREVSRFNAEHQNIIDTILATEEVSRLDHELF